MKKRLILLAGLGVGYILGSRTGRQSYEKLKAQLQELWTDPKVQETVEKANQSIREKAPAVADAVQTATDKVTAAAQELDGDEDANATPGTGSRSTGSGPASTGSATGSGSTGSATSAGPNRSAAGSTGAAASRSTTGPGSTGSTTGPGSTGSTTGPGSTGSTTGPGSTGSTAGSGPATGASRAGTPTPTPGPKPTPTPKRAEDVITDPSRSIEDEGPAASANR
ncbi:hypothetical protein ACP6NG_00875 [Brevibacterium casei]|uniref:YtxH domain-containing protein n=1 Tax=Brevibacterium casei TaxID=33889 RepID=A0A269ZGI9_9MICO|nr:hypothetical protein [Brevibacterium casei]PAK96855.1 hypothetical protein B8X04_02830 [Brevibacterium casei]